MSDAESKLPGGSHRMPWLAVGGGLAVLALGAFVVLSGPLGGPRPASFAQAQQAGPANVSLAEAIFPVEGMSCGACAARIKKTLKPMDGVAAVEVSLERRNVRVRYAKGTLIPEVLAKAINDLGYKASPDISLGSRDLKWRDGLTRYRVWVSTRTIPCPEQGHRHDRL